MPRADRAGAAAAGSARPRQQPRADLLLHLLRHRVGPLGPPGQHAPRLLPGPDEPAGVQRLDRVEAELQRRDDAEVAAAPAEGPEEVGLGVRVGADGLAVGRHDLDGGHRVGGEPVATAEPAHAAAEGVADDAHVRGRPVQGGQPVLGGQGPDVPPLDARLHPRGAARRIDRGSAHARGVDQKRALEVAAWTGPVPGGLDGDAQSGRARGPHGRGHLLGVAGHEHRIGPLIDREVPSPAGVVPSRGARHQDIEGGQAARGRGGIGAHRGGPFVACPAGVVPPSGAGAED